MALIKGTAQNQKSGNGGQTGSGPQNQQQPQQPQPGSQQETLPGDDANAVDNMVPFGNLEPDTVSSLTHWPQALLTPAQGLDLDNMYGFANNNDEANILEDFDFGSFLQIDGNSFDFAGDLGLNPGMNSSNEVADNVAN